MNYLDGHRIFVFIPSQNLNEMFCISDAFSETSFWNSKRMWIISPWSSYSGFTELLEANWSLSTAWNLCILYGFFPLSVFVWGKWDCLLGWWDSKWLSSLLESDESGHVASGGAQGSDQHSQFSSCPLCCYCMTLWRASHLICSSDHRARQGGRAIFYNSSSGLSDGAPFGEEVSTDAAVDHLLDFTVQHSGLYISIDMCVWACRWSDVSALMCMWSQIYLICFCLSHSLAFCLL